MREQATKWIVRLVSFAIAALLLFLALRGVDLAEVWLALKAANYWWAIPLAGITVLSHWLRSIRWRILLESLPERSANSRPISTWNTFISIMIGYMSNYAGPRIGEFIRTGNVAQREKIPFTSVLGTVFVERVLDMVAFGLFLLTIPLVFSRKTAELWHLLTAPLWAFYEETSPIWILIAGIMLVVAVLIFVILAPRISRNPNSKVFQIVAQFRNGMVSLLHTGKPLKMTLLTVTMWMCYGLMAYLPFVLLGLDSTYQIGPIDAWGIMLIGSLGVIIPSPGGIGTFHFVTIQSLAILFAMPSTDAATYALLVHTGQMLLYLLLGTLGILYLGSLPNQLGAPKQKEAASND